jgi:hypothetical protein
MLERFPWFRKHLAFQAAALFACAPLRVFELVL